MIGEKLTAGFIVKNLSIAVLTCGFVFGDLSTEGDLQFLSPKREECEEIVLVAERTNGLKGIALISSRDQLNASGYQEISGVEFRDLDLPGPCDDLNYLLSSRFMTLPIDECMILEVKKTVIGFYRKHDRPIVTVIVPAQDWSSGVLQLLVVEGRVGEIKVCGNEYFSACRLRNYFNVQEGEPIRTSELNKDVSFINRNPFRRVDLVYAAGKEPGMTDIDLLVKDRLPVRFYAGIDNTGNSVTGNNRLFTGFNWGNAFNLDHLLSFQFSSSDDFKSFLGYVGQYTIPLPIKHLISLYGGYSTVDSKFEVPEAVGTKFRNSGYNAQGSFRYEIPLGSFNSYLQEISWGADFKRMNNNLEFGGVPVFSKNVNLFQFMLSYNMGYESKNWVATFEIEGFASPMQWLPDQTNEIYQTLRPFAKTRYIYGRASFSWVHYFSSWCQYAVYLRGQAADVNLLPSEEYGVGGYDTVRGYEEREVNGDDAFVANVELVSAPFSPGGWFKRCRNLNDNMQLLAFFDCGGAFIHKPSPGQKGSQYLYSMGPGLRYQMRTNLTARVDWGFQLHHVTPGTPHQRLHFQLIGSY